MFARRNKPEGFEWHKYIRTTVKLRREQRRQRVHDARRAAAQQVNVAGNALAAGSRAAGAAARDGMRAGAGAAGLAAQGLFAIAGHTARGLFAMAATGLALAGRALATALHPLIEALARPQIGGVVAFFGGMALGAGLGRYRSMGLDREAATTLVIATFLIIGTLPMLSRLTGIRVPGVSISPQAVLAGLLVVLAGGGAAWVATQGHLRLAGLGARLPFIGGGKELRGHAQVVGGDVLRIAGTTVRLAGIEAPERGQNCGSGGRSSRCGAAAETALGRIISGHSVRCSLGGTDSSGRRTATCMAGKVDIAAELVRRGHVFADSGLLSSYGAQEREARAAKAGLWSAESAERPEQFRAKLWEEAKKRAPDGCPIKGLVTSSGRVYVLPWSPDYTRERVQKTRGERWFCSEREAQAAGWKAAVRG